MTRRRALHVQVLELRLAPALATWDGGGADDHWTTAANWAGDVAPQPGDDLLFPTGAAHLSNVNDFPDGTAFGQIQVTGLGYLLSGNRVNLSGGISVNVPFQSIVPVITHIALPLTLAGDQSFVCNFDGPVALSGPIDVDGFTLRLDIQSFEPSIISGVMSGSGQIVKSSSGSLKITAVNAFSGPMEIAAGRLELTGTLPGPMTLDANTSLLGNGTTGPLTVNGAILQPGLSQEIGIFVQPAVLTVGNLSIAGGSDASFALTDHGVSRLDVHGTVQLGGAIFVDTQDSPRPLAIGQSAVLIANDGTDPIIGTFAGAPEGAIVRQGAIPLQITYHGGDGNDVAVTAISQTAYAVAAGAGGLPIVNVYDAENHLIRSFLAYQPAFRGGVHVTTADVTRDLVPDIITAPGPGGGPVVRIWDGATGAMIREFNAYDPAFRGGVWLATARIVPNAPLDIITGAGPGGGPHVRIFDSVSGVAVGSFFAFDASFRGGITVAGIDGFVSHAGSFPGTVVVGAGAGGAPIVRTFFGVDGSPGTTFFAYDPAFRGGVNVAVGSLVNANDIVTAPLSGGGPHVKIFSSALTNGQPPMLEREFLAYSPAFTGGVTIGVRQLDATFPATLITGAGAGGGPHVEEWSHRNDFALPTSSFFAFDPTFLGGVFVG